MTREILKWATCVIAAASVFTGCSKKEEATETAAPAETPTESAAPAAPTASAAAQPAATPEAEVLPGQAAVRSAMKAKNYNAAVTQLLAMKNGLPAEMWTTYTDFYGEVRNTLIEEAQKDPNAAQALMMLRAGTAGR